MNECMRTHLLRVACACAGARVHPCVYGIRSYIIIVCAVLTFVRVHACVYGHTCTYPVRVACVCGYICAHRQCVWRVRNSVTRFVMDGSRNQDNRQALRFQLRVGGK